MNDFYSEFMKRRHRLRNRTFYALRNLVIVLSFWAIWAFLVFVQYL